MTGTFAQHKLPNEGTRCPTLAGLIIRIVHTFAFCRIARPGGSPMPRATHRRSSGASYSIILEAA